MSKLSIGSLIGAFVITSMAIPGANGLELPTSTRLVMPDSSLEGAKLITATGTELGQSVKELAAIGLSPALMTSSMSKLAALNEQVEMARTIVGAKKVAKAIMSEKYGWGKKQFDCVNRLWTKESHWNYKAHNYSSGAHGIAQALPASKMAIISDDWRANPVTQIRWGLHYIDLRYETPCKAWSKFKRSRYY
jgi:hypothetical protein